jgi:hypothetical protein
VGRRRPQDRLIAATFATVVAIAVALVATGCGSGGSDERAKGASTTLVATWLSWVIRYALGVVSDPTGRCRSAR